MAELTSEKELLRSLCESTKLTKIHRKYRIHNRKKTRATSRGRSACIMGRRARRELNPGQPGVFREVKASPEMALPVLYLFRIPCWGIWLISGPGRPTRSTCSMLDYFAIP